MALAFKQITDFRSNQEVFAKDLTNRMKILTDKTQQLEQKQAIFSAQQMTTDYRPATSQQDIIVEQTIRNFQHKLNSLSDQLTTFQSNQGHQQYGSDISNLSIKIDNVEKQHQQLYNELSNAKHASAQRNADTKLHLFESEKSQQTTLKSLEKSTQSIINQVNDKINNIDHAIKQDLHNSLNSITSDVDAELKGFSLAAQNLRHDLTMKIDSIHTYSVDRYQSLTSSIQEEKRRMTSLVSQSDTAIKELESFIRQSHKSTEKIIFAEITKREKNSKMINQLDKSIKEICVELDNRLKHYETTTKNNLQTLRKDLKAEIVENFEKLTGKLQNHSDELETLNSLVHNKFNDVTDLCNKNFSNFTDQLRNKLEILQQQLTETEINSAKDHTKLQTCIDNQAISQDQIVENFNAQQETAKLVINKIKAEINDLRSNLRESKSTFETFKKQLVTTEKSLSVKTDFLRQEHTHEIRSFESKIHQLEGRLNGLENIIKIDGKKVNSVWTAVLAEASASSISQKPPSEKQTESHFTDEKGPPRENSVLQSCNSIHLPEVENKAKNFVPGAVNNSVNRWSVDNAYFWMKLLKKWKTYQREFEILDIDSRFSMLGTPNRSVNVEK